MKVNHSTLAPLLGSNVIVCHNLFEGEGKLTYSPAFGKYFVFFGESATIGFKIKENLRLQALKKLTKEEKEALGLV